MRLRTRIAGAIVVTVGLEVAALTALAMNNENPADFSDAHWIWDAGEAHPSNYFLMVRKTFSLEGPIDSAVLYVTASDRYVLHVNGQYVGRGPARSVPQFKSYDSYQIGEKRKSGTNAIAVLTYRYGQNTSPSEPEGFSLPCAAISEPSGGGTTARGKSVWISLEV